MALKFVASVACAAMAGLLFAAPASAQNRMKECGAEWTAMKTAKQTGDKKWADFRKECMARAASASSPAVEKPAAKKSTTTSGGRAAMQARLRACSADWKADKAAGKVAAGMKWPKYWSACNTRKKAAGA